MAEQLKPGDTVKLRSGGPLMTIDSINADDEVYCEWFDDKQQPQSKVYGVHMLEKDDGTV
jgi:uncharacterized protein YodC (DUF2158 family)